MNKDQQHSVASGKVQAAVSMATSNATSATTTTTTPVRNNYAEPHTPIASVKRPRSSLDRAPQRTPAKTPSSSTPSSTMSPMHPPRPAATPEDSASWVGRKVDALFSPVLNFLQTSPAKEEDVATITDEDVAMEDQELESNPEPDDLRVLKKPSEEEYGDLEEDPSSSFDEDEFNPYLFIKSLPRYDLVASPRTCLPPKSRDSPSISLVLDLDETLVHCTVIDTPNADLVFPIVFHGMSYRVHVRLRPFLFQFLEMIAGKYEVIVFTASQQIYAEELLRRIDPNKKYFQHHLFRESCLQVEGNFLKDLNVLGRDLSKTVLVDNSPHAFGYQVDNGIPIESWFDDPNDTELLKLEKFLSTLQDAQDVRHNVRLKFRTFARVQNA